ncbi:hypothetical protein C9J03_09770 [Photobacterium gaetbulicola]|nr:hypothetical protein C9J03_09770 [Photobacterium gaetbulicola]
MIRMPACLFHWFLCFLAICFINNGGQQAVFPHKERSAAVMPLRDNWKGIKRKAGLPLWDA